MFPTAHGDRRLYVREVDPIGARVQVRLEREIAVNLESAQHAESTARHGGRVRATIDGNRQGFVFGHVRK